MNVAWVIRQLRILAPRLFVAAALAPLQSLGPALCMVRDIKVKSGGSAFHFYVAHPALHAGLLVAAFIAKLSYYVFGADSG
jgi:hypothetical protein